MAPLAVAQTPDTAALRGIGHRAKSAAAHGRAPDHRGCAPHDRFAKCTPAREAILSRTIFRREQLWKSQPRIRVLRKRVRRHCAGLRLDCDLQISMRIATARAEVRVTGEAGEVRIG